MCRCLFSIPIYLLIDTKLLIRKSGQYSFIWMSFFKALLVIDFIINVFNTQKYF